MLNLNVLPLPNNILPFPVKIVLLEPECDVCGSHVNAVFLKKWNERNVCVKCINELTGDIPYE